MFSLATMVVALMAGGVAPSDSTEAIASRYLELTFDQRYEALRDVYAEDVLFVDPKPNGGGSGYTRSQHSPLWLCTRREEAGT